MTSTKTEECTAGCCVRCATEGLTDLPTSWALSRVAGVTVGRQTQCTTTKAKGEEWTGDSFSGPHGGHKSQIGVWTHVTTQNKGAGVLGGGRCWHGILPTAGYKNCLKVKWAGPWLAKWVSNFLNLVQFKVSGLWDGALQWAEGAGLSSQRGSLLEIPSFFCCSSPPALSFSLSPLLSKNK